MSNATLFSQWNPSHRQVWGQVPLCINHRLDTSPLLALASLADLIESYPRHYYSLIHTGTKQTRKTWAEGDIGALSGNAVISAIENGQLWLNLRNIEKIDLRYKDLVEQLFSELSQQIPGFLPQNRQAGILISSPNAEVYYHADLPGQGLLQLHGSKRVFVYPDRAPFLTPVHLEDICLFGVETDMPYEPYYDEYAFVQDLRPGQMMHWPLNAPHRVENHDCLNVSMTISYTNKTIARREKIHLANAILRRQFGLPQRQVQTTGLGYFAKAALQKLLKNRSWIRNEQSARRAVVFKLDSSRCGQTIDKAKRSTKEH